MTPEQLTIPMLKAIQLEKWHSLLMLDVSVEAGEQRVRCEAHIRRIGELLTVNERAQIEFLQHRSEARRIRHLGLCAKNAYSVRRNRYQNFVERVRADKAVDCGQLEEFGLMVEPDTFSLWDEDREVPVMLPPDAFDGKLETIEPAVPGITPVEPAIKPLTQLVEAA
jgi:hypothetical protein